MLDCAGNGLHGLTRAFDSISRNASDVVLAPTKTTLHLHPPGMEAREWSVLDMSRRI